jgi:hypothetical protein
MCAVPHPLGAAAARVSWAIVEKRSQRRGAAAPNGQAWSTRGLFTGLLGGSHRSAHFPSSSGQRARKICLQTGMLRCRAFSSPIRCMTGRDGLERDGIVVTGYSRNRNGETRNSANGMPRLPAAGTRGLYGSRDYGRHWRSTEVETVV